MDGATIVSQVNLAFWIVMLLLHVYLCIQEFMEQKSTTNLEIKKTVDVAFPVFTICPLEAEGFKLDKLAESNLTKVTTICASYGRPYFQNKVFRLMSCLAT